MTFVWLAYKKYYFQRENIFWENAYHHFSGDDLTDPLMLNFNGSIKIYFNGPDETTWWPKVTILLVGAATLVVEMTDYCFSLVSVGIIVIKDTKIVEK